jgi:hypothetical protein
MHWVRIAFAIDADVRMYSRCFETSNRKRAGKIDAEYHQPGDATTFKSIVKEYGEDGEVLGLVVGYSGDP